MYYYDGDFRIGEEPFTVVKPYLRGKPFKFVFEFKNRDITLKNQDKIKKFCSEMDRKVLSWSPFNVNPNSKINLFYFKLEAKNK